MLKRFLWTIIAVATIYWFYTALKPIEIQVQGVTLSSGEVVQTINNSRAGSIKACQRSKLSMPRGGRVSELLVKQGDKVEKGQVLLKLWNDDQKAMLKQNQAMLEAARLKHQEICYHSDYANKEAQRQVDLDKQQLTTQHNVEQAITQQKTIAASCAQSKVHVKQAEAVVDMQQAILSQTELVAPFSGVIAEINGEIGEFVTPSPPGVPTPPAVDLINTECFYVTTPIDEIDAAYLKKGQFAKITLDAFPGRSFPAKLTRIAPYVQEMERQARTVDVDLELTNIPTDAHLLIGYSADAQIILNKVNDVLRIPTQALLDGNKVFIVDAQSKVSQIEIQIGLQNWSWTEVKSGLSEGDTIITSLDTENLAIGVSVSNIELIKND